MKFVGTCIFTLACLVVSGGALAGPAPTPDFLARHIFLGQAYPSGNIYLMPFPQPVNQSEDDYLKSFPWPLDIHYRSLSSNHPYAVQLREGRLARVIHDVIRPSGPTANIIYSTYIPALELMDDRQHQSCDGKPVPPRNSRYQYLGEDFFNQVLDNCNTTEGVPVYKTSETGNYSYAVLAFDKAIELTEIELPNGNKRPTTPREAARVAKMKKEVAESEKEDSECYTNPSYIDEATILLTAKVKGTDLSIRVSTYGDPGCGGHMANIYILDVLKASALLKKFEMTQYVGLI